MNNLDTWNKVCRPPATALKQIGGGRLKGMTDINPQWRLQAMTEIYGECGVGWYYDIKRFWTEPGATSETMCFVHLELFTSRQVSSGFNWSKPITGIGGSTLVAMEKAGLHSNDEGYKMATTDALSVAMKQLGFGADIYMGRWDGSKYKDAPPENNGKPTQNPQFNPEFDELTYLESVVDTVLANKIDYIASAEYLHGLNLDPDQKTWIWDKLDSKTRAGIKGVKLITQPPVMV